MLLPIFLKLAGRRCLIVGAGKVALEKVTTLLKAGAQVRVVAPEAVSEIHALAETGKIFWDPREFRAADLAGVFLAITATNDGDVNSAVYQAALKRNVICNSVDDIPNCDFYFGSIVNRGKLQIAISTAGESPALAQRLRREIDGQLPDDLGPWLEQIGQLRRDILATYPNGEDRRLLLHRLAERKVCESESCSLHRSAQRIPSTQPGKVYLVGAGPGDPELLTVKASRILASADVVLHDDLVPEAILELARRDAEVINVGKRCGAKHITQEQINSLLIEHALAGRSVARLKSGDPMIFGRANEEIGALKAAGIQLEIVPGITAAFAAASELELSLTDRHSASGVVFSTGHHAQSHNDAPIPAVEDATRVVYMPGRDLRTLAAQWAMEGLPPNFPCAIISRAAQPGQEVQRTTLGELGETEPGAAPSILLAGWALKDVGSVAGKLTSEARSKLPANTAQDLDSSSEFDSQGVGSFARDEYVHEEI